MADFATAYKAVLGNEGGYTVNSKDPGNWTGGKVGVGILIGTIWGMSAPNLSSQFGIATPAQARLVTIEQVTPFAKAKYWDAYQCDDMPQIVADEVLDIAYNGGHAADWLQEAVHATVNGKVDSTTLVLLECANPYAVIAHLDGRRLQYWRSLKSWPTFGGGWVDRVAANLLRYAP